MTPNANDPNGQDPASDSRGFHVGDYLTFVVRRKELLIVTFLISLLMCYGGIFFFIEEQFEASAVIVPRDDKSLAGFGDMLRGIKGLPLGLGAQSIGVETDLYKTIIYSRSMMERVVVQFRLLEVYDLDTADASHMERAVKRLREEVVTKETEESAFVVTVRAASRQRAADMANFVVRNMNEMIVNLKASSSKESRIFLEKRVEEVKTQLRSSEDSLRSFQEKSGLLDTKVQIQGILTAYSELESEMTARELQKEILLRAFDKESPQVRDVEVQIEEYKKKLSELRTQGDPGGPMIALKKLPETTVEYLRRFREVEINNLLLEYIVPMYEQARIEEKRDYPILQVIDYAVPPSKKSYPPRTVLSLIGAFSTTILVAMGLYFRRSYTENPDPFWRSLMAEAKHWTWDSLKKQ